MNSNVIKSQLLTMEKPRFVDTQKKAPINNKKQVTINVPKPATIKEKKDPYEHIWWDSRRIESMLVAQKKINELILTPNVTISQELKDKLKKLQHDMTELYTSTCDVCGNKQSKETHMNIEMIKMRESWGYESNYDGDTHSLTMCCDCYGKYIFNGPLGKFVKVTHYM